MAEPSSSSAVGEATFIRRARRSQIIETTIDLVAEKGHAGVSLSGIAERIGITKPAVLYHFPSKNAVMWAAYEQVLHGLVTHVGDAVDAASAENGPSVYARSMIGYLSARPRHVRMITESLSVQEDERDTSARWGPLAQIIQQARRARGLEPDPDGRTTALIIGGAIDSIVSEKRYDPDYDAHSAAERLVGLIEAAYSQ